MIEHHLTDALLMAYSAGSLPEAFDLAVATHLSLCDTCRAATESYDAVGGALVEQSAGIDVSDECLETTLARIRGAAPEPEPHRIDAGGVLPEPLAAYVGGSLEDVAWRPAGMGVKQAILDAGTEASARLLFIPAGTAVPDHSHRGTEITVVLQGAFRDGDETFGRGDVEIATGSIHHQPVADASEACVCLAVTEAPLRFRGILPRLAQPFLKI